MKRNAYASLTPAGRRWMEGGVSDEAAATTRWGVFVIRPLGNIGIGTTAPHVGARLHVEGGGNQGVLLPQVALTSATSWAPVSGTAVDGMVVYNTATVGSGQNAVVPGYYYWRAGRWRRFSENGYAGVIMGTLSSTSTSLTTTAPNMQYMNAYIDLPPGKWIVFSTQLLTCNLGSGQWIWVRTTFSEGVPWAGYSPDIVGSPLISGGMVYPAYYSLVIGQVVIHNTSGATKRYYYYAQRAQTTCAPSNIGTNLQGENQLFAIPAE